MLEVSGASLFRAKVKERALSIQAAAEPVPISDLELVPICGEYEYWCSGKDLLMRAKKVGANFGQDQVEYMLERTNEFPEGWDHLSLHFTEVLMHDQGKFSYDGPSPYYPFFYRNGEWTWDFALLDARHPASGRLVRSRCR